MNEEDLKSIRSYAEEIAVEDIKYANKKGHKGYYRKKRYLQNIWNNNGTWWINYTNPHTKQRFRYSLKTKCKKTALKLRNKILVGYYSKD